jgi:3-oxoadipate enol-lactonase
MPGTGKSAATLNYAMEGQGERVVLLHPVGLDLASWDAVAARLAGRFRILRVDLRGHGASPAVDPNMELGDYAWDVHRLVAELDFAPAAMVGLSFGGMVAQAFALDFPAVLSRLVVAGCPCTLPDAARMALAARGLAAIEHGMASQIEETLQRWFTLDFIASGGAEAIRRQLLDTDAAAWNSAWRAISRIDTATRLHEIAIPTLCIAGELDPASPPAALAEITRRIAGARLAVLPKTPHMMQVECPERLASILDDFLSGREVGAPVV